MQEKRQSNINEEEIGHREKTIPSGSQELGYLWLLRIEIFFNVTKSTVLIAFNVTDVLLCLHSFYSL